MAERRQDPNLCIVMIDRTDLNNIRGNPVHSVDAFRRHEFFYRTIIYQKEIRP
ncbi:MAG: hypothetical protein FD149_1537 [Rhodospirillaceae bacterium]|nr:MAG: hypothetical protein FD149_1537 [Rhodospirillaceae bacterium]